MGVPYGQKVNRSRKKAEKFEEKKKNMKGWTKWNRKMGGRSGFITSGDFGHGVVYRGQWTMCSVQRANALKIHIEDFSESCRYGKYLSFAALATPITVLGAEQFAFSYLVFFAKLQLKKF